MSASWVTAALVALCVSPLGHCEQNGGDKYFQIDDRKFEHSWATKKSMPDKRSDMTATTIGDAIYLVGGCALDQEWVPDYKGYSCGGSKANGITGATVRYYPKTDTFDTDLPSAPRPRYRHAAAAVDNMLYMFGGVDGSDNIIPQVDVFDTVKGKWSTLSEKMPGATTDLSAFVHAGRIYVTGGYTPPTYDAQKVTQIFNPTAADGQSWTTGPSLSAGRGDAFAAIVGDKAYVGAGFTHENSWEMPLASMEMFHIGHSTTFKAVKDLDIARGDKAVAVLNDILHVVGGETKNPEGHSVPLTDVEAYDPATNKWYKGGSINSHRFRFVAAAHGDTLFIFGGQGYLVGEYGKAGSKYPVLDAVEAYTETVTLTQVNWAERVLPTMSFLVILVGLGMWF